MHVMINLLQLCNGHKKQFCCISGPAEHSTEQPEGQDQCEGFFLQLLPLHCYCLHGRYVERSEECHLVTERLCSSPRHNNLLLVIINAERVQLTSTLNKTTLVSLKYYNLVIFKRDGFATPSFSDLALKAIKNHFETIEKKCKFSDFASSSLLLNSLN